MKLIVQPGDGIRPLVKAINDAKKSVEIVIFRFDQREIEQALAKAVGRGVAVTALIASTNSAGEDNLRKLESRLLGFGVTVARTHDDLIRYHSKFMVIDRHELFLLAFNYTHADIDHCRSFGLIINNREIVQEAVDLFESDVKRTPFEPKENHLVVSPINARRQLEAFIADAKKSLAIYDPQVSDHTMVRLLGERAQAGVDVRIIGRLVLKVPGISVHKMPDMRLHTRTIIRDGNAAFTGSQSLREAELDSRREVGIIFRDAKIVATLMEVFDGDWALAERSAQTQEANVDPAAKFAKKVAKAVTREMPAVGPIVESVVEEMGEMDLVPEEVEEVVKGAVKEAVKEAVLDALEGALESD